MVQTITKEFKDTQFMTAQEKMRVLKQWETFLKHGCKKEHFTKPLYHHLIQHCSFIAHYDLSGFYSTYFASGDGRARFLSQFDHRNGAPNSIEYGATYWHTQPEYSDINSEMCRVAAKYISGLLKAADSSQRDYDIAMAQALLKKHGIILKLI